MHLLKNTGRTLAAYILVGGLAACGGNDGGEEETTAEAKTEKPAEKASAKKAEAEVDGQLFAAVNDDRRSWYVTHLESDGDWQSGSFWRAMSLKDTYQVTLFGLTSKAAKPSGKGDVMMSLVVQGETNNVRVVSAELTFFADGLSKTWTSENSGGAKVMLNRFIIDGDYIDIGGGFSGVVELPADSAASTEQPETFEIKDGSFAVRVRQFQR